MEARNFISAQSMALDGDWLIPHLFTEIRLNKPPLPVWLTVPAFLLDPHPSMLALHIPVILVTALMAVFCVGLHEDICGKSRASLYAGLVSVSMLMTIKLGITNSWDIYSVAFMAGTLVSLLKQGRGWLIGGILCMAASIMSKGPVQLYTMLLPFLAASLLCRRPIAWKRLAYVLGYGSLLGSLWYLFVYLAVPHAATTIAKGEVHAWSNRHLASFFYYLSFPIFAGAWFLPLLASLFRRWLGRSEEERSSQRFLLVWFLLSLLLLSLVPEKKERYLMPAFIPLALMTASTLHIWVRSLKEGTLPRIETLLVRWHLRIGTLAAVGLCLFVAWNNSAHLLYVLPFALLCLGAGLLGEKKPQTVVLVTCLLILFTVSAAWRGGSTRPMMQKTPPTCTLEEFRTLPRLEGLPFYSFGGFGPTEEWEAGRDITFAESLSVIPEQRFVLLGNIGGVEEADHSLRISERFLIQTSRGKYLKFSVVERLSKK
jgi:4-amino-4-deoxy-L-arabinose transferase-like glycosyltransferase